MILSPQIHILVLAGGQSSRMGMDKSQLRVIGPEQEVYMADLGKKLGLPTFISKGKDYTQTSIAGHPVIHDVVEKKGPIGAIHSAFMYRPDAAWLVLACDLPFIQESDLEYLMKRRNPKRFATAFQIKGNTFPEPLICIYEPSIREKISKALEDEKLSPMKLLQALPITRVSLDDHRVAFNVNTPEELTIAQDLLNR